MFGSTFDAIHAVSSAVDVIASMRSSSSYAGAVDVATAAVDVATAAVDRLSSRSLSLREMMRRATCAARAISGLDDGAGAAGQYGGGEEGSARPAAVEWPTFENVRAGERCS